MSSVPQANNICSPTSATYKLSTAADPYAQAWFKTHAFEATASQAQTGSTAVGNKILYFPQNELKVNSSLAANDDQEQMPIQLDLKPLRIRGTLAGTKIHCQVGLAPTPEVFYSLGDLKGDFAEGDITQHFNGMPFYKGTVTIEKPEPGVIGSLFVKVDWKGLGLKLEKTAFDVLAPSRSS